MIGPDHGIQSYSELRMAIRVERKAAENRALIRHAPPPSELDGFRRQSRRKAEAPPPIHFHRYRDATG